MEMVENPCQPLKVYGNNMKMVGNLLKLYGNNMETVENPLPFLQYQYTVYTNSLCTWSFEHAADDA